MIYILACMLLVTVLLLLWFLAMLADQAQEIQARDEMLKAASEKLEGYSKTLAESAELSAKAAAERDTANRRWSMAMNRIQRLLAQFKMHGITPED